MLFHTIYEVHLDQRLSDQASVAETVGVFRLLTVGCSFLQTFAVSSDPNGTGNGTREVMVFDFSSSLLPLALHAEGGVLEILS
jgi:hypothetical protein